MVGESELAMLTVMIHTSIAMRIPRCRGSSPEVASFMITLNCPRFLLPHDERLYSFAHTASSTALMLRPKMVNGCSAVQIL